jgi:LCP family protein required for cell wall assembly
MSLSPSAIDRAENKAENGNHSLVRKKSGFLTAGEAGDLSHILGIIYAPMNNPFDPHSAKPGQAAPPADPDAPTKPSMNNALPENLPDSLSDFQAIRITPPKPSPTNDSPPRDKKPPKRGCGCWLLLVLILGVLIVYLIFPLRTNIVLLGIDARAPGEIVGRSDTMILLSMKPVGRSTGLLSIPRDLWVNIPGVGENRINTAHFFAEAAQPGSGPDAVKGVIQANFGVEVNYYVRASFDNFKLLIDAMGGVEIDLAESMGGYAAGVHVLDGDQALAFVRDRTSGGDDFSRMRQTQVLVRGLIQTALVPSRISEWPEMAAMAMGAVETDVPSYMWPRLAMAVLLSLPDGIDGRVISREMVSPFTTSGGAQVLLPRWELIEPLIVEMFGD